MQTIALRWSRASSREREFLLLVAPALLLLAAFFLLPLANVFQMSVKEPTWGVHNYAVIASEGVQRVALRTVKLCAITTLVAVLLGYLVAYVLAASSARQRLAMTFFILVPFWVSALAKAFAWLLLLGRDGPLNRELVDAGWIADPFQLLFSETGVLIGMVHYMIPYAVLPLYSAMKDIDPQLVRASRGLGASPLRAFIHTYLPVTFPAVFAAAGLVMVYGLAFYVIPAILGGGRVLMIAQYISINVIETVRWGIASTIAVYLLVTVLVLAYAARRFGGAATGAAT